MSTSARTPRNRGRQPSSAIVAFPETLAVSHSCGMCGEPAALAGRCQRCGSRFITASIALGRWSASEQGAQRTAPRRPTLSVLDREPA